MKSEIVFEKTYYLPNFLEDSKPKYRQFNGMLFLRTFYVHQTSKRMFLRMKHGIVSFSGSSRNQMCTELENLIRGKKELPGEADGDNKFIPQEVRSFLRKHKGIPLKVEL